jgi:hypothetical protein
LVFSSTNTAGVDEDAVEANLAFACLVVVVIEHIVDRRRARSRRRRIATAPPLIVSLFLSIRLSIRRPLSHHPSSLDAFRPSSNSIEFPRRWDGDVM